jgi:tRNA A37 methylthiotransferase MiaB
MRIESNKFGSGEMYEASDLQTPIYLYGCACMSIQSEALSFANYYHQLISRKVITTDPKNAASIVVLSCQVTDLAVLNDLRKATQLHREHRGAQIYVGGCLAKRFDIQLPEWARRVEALRQDYQEIQDNSLVTYSKPFWATGFKQDDSPLAEGHLFRDMYPLRIGVGCKKSCTYCTIRITRGEFYQLETKRLIPEFLNNPDVVLICESPTFQQIHDWCDLARICNKSISIRNLEPDVYTQTSSKIFDLAQKHLLKILHIPVQSTNPDTLASMGRNAKCAAIVLQDMQAYRDLGTVTATNVIVDYKDFPNPTKEELAVFDYVSWNPYWDGTWNQSKAVERFAHYLG